MRIEQSDHAKLQIIASINPKQKNPLSFSLMGFKGCLQPIFLKLIDNINCYYMKLQIISRLTKNQKPRIDSIKEILTSNVYMHTETGDRRQNMNEYYSINTEWTANHQENTPKFNPREFFNNFNTLCDVKYEPIDYKPIETKRRLLGILESKRNQTKVPQKQPQRQETIANKLSQFENDPKYNYFSQRAKQKIRKVNSLISFDHEENSNKIEASRKPGFIKQNKSLKKKQSSLQISKVFQANKENIDPNNLNSKMQIKYGSSNVGLEIDDSKERIANIRRELNQIYQMRNRHGQNKLRLN